MNLEYITISTKGQIIIPSAIRQQLNLVAGTRLSIEREGQVLILRPVTVEFINSLCGATRGLGKIREKMHREDKDR
jgi:AbrB family looped-hinge helix DNA binding protein